MTKRGIIFGAVIGAAAATILANSKKSAESLIKKGKRKLKDKVDEILD
jgi:gas vesicle protein